MQSRKPVKSSVITDDDLISARKLAIVFVDKQDKLEINLKQNDLLAQRGSREFSHQNFFGFDPESNRLGRDGTIALQTAIELSKELVFDQ